MSTSQPQSVPLLDLRAQYAPLRAEIDAVLKFTFDNTVFVLGKSVEDFENAIASWLGADHAIGCASGGDALLLMLMAHDIGPGDDVICPTFTFFATGGTIARTGARPIFCDIDPATYNIDVPSLERALERCNNLKAIMPVHLYGQAADNDAIATFARTHNAVVLEDAAQAIGTCDRNGRRIGSQPHMQGWSFYPTKNLGAAGDAGLVTVTGDSDLAEKIRRLRVHGGKDRYYHDMIGLNSRLDALQAAVLSVKLPHLDTWNAQRQAHAAYYDERFAEAGALASDVSLDVEPGNALPLRYPYYAGARQHHIYHQYIVRVPVALRPQLREYLRDAGVGNEVFYPLPLHQQECFAYLEPQPHMCPHAEQAAREVLALPIYPELREEQLKRVADCVVTFCEQHRAVGSHA